MLIHDGGYCAKDFKCGESRVFRECKSIGPERDRSPRAMTDEATRRLKITKRTVIVQYALCLMVCTDSWFVLCINYVLDTEKWSEGKVLDGEAGTDLPPRPDGTDGC